MSQSSAIPARYTGAQGRIWRDVGQAAYPGDMVADMLTLLMLTAATVAGTGSQARVEVGVTATIQRGVTLRDGTASTRAAEVAPIRRKPRECTPVQKARATASPDCRLIVYDLP